ncbi:MAG: class II fructose-bisphosphatase [Anaerolineales bacterium]
MTENLYHNLGLDLVRATEAAALVAGRWMGLNEANRSDHYASQAMERVLNLINIHGRIVLSEIDKLKPDTPLHLHQSVGAGDGPQIDIIVDPIEGRRLLARGHPDVISVAVSAPRNAFWDAKPALYMDKIVVDAEVASVLVPECLDAPAGWTLALVARAKKKEISDLVVFVLSRPRHEELIHEIRQAGARVILRSDGDIIGALQALLPQGGADIMMGIGRVSEGVIAACAAQAANGAMLGRLTPQSDEELNAVREAGLDIDRVLTMDEMVTSKQVFFAATGVTDGVILQGIHYHSKRATSNSLLMRGETHTHRDIEATHLLEELD